MKILQADKTHIPLIQEIAFNTWPLTFGDILSEEQIKYMLEMMYSSESLKNQMEVKQHQFIILQSETNPIGFASFEFLNGFTKIHKIYLLPTEQGRGSGRKMLNQISSISIQKNIHKLSLNVNRFNQAVQFYLRTGFVIVKEENIDIGNGFLMEDYVMEKFL
jgi:diamine N-acetyltransferase